MDHGLTPPPASFNFARHLFELNRPRAAKAAYLDDARALSYGELEERARRFAAALVALGMRREERLLLAMHDTVDWPVAFLGALHAGVVPVAVNTLLVPEDFAYMLAHSRARAVAVSAALRPVMEQVLEKGGHEANTLIVAGDDAPAASGTLSVHPLSALLADHAPAERAAATQADDIAFWLYSSGSTGRPKGTVHSHANLYWTAETYGRHVLGLRESDTVFSAAKLFFAYGLGNALTFPLSVGATVVLMPERPTPKAVFRRLVERRPTVFYGVPTLYVSMLADADAPDASALSLRLCTSAGEALPRDVGERFQKAYGCPIIDGIGSTEMLHVFLSNRPEDVRYGTTGKPVPGYGIELRDDAGRPVGDGEIGDLWIDGPSAALMYWCNREKTTSTFQGRWTKSGDKYQRDADGYYTYAGRSDDMLKVSGQYVSPFEVEAALMQHPSVLEAAVTGIADEEGLTKTMAWVVTRAGTMGTPALEDELKAFVKDRLAPYKYPRVIAFIDELPKTATGKIQRFRLRERANEAFHG